ncbi:phenylacetate--CoA ligase family protein [Elioraea rosea]|uniref:phenylacetate--CoA ligase family protein n=1 Tax=Elioraea rosea TaxID=2492390 RepID=UPI0011822D2E|nr:phenylacetate--CoA ligase family protein [Elioraea rosea]
MTLQHAFGQAVDLAAAYFLSRRFKARDGWTREQLLAHQRDAFKVIVRHAAHASPFYRTHYRGIEIADGPEPSQLPVTNKRLLMDNLEAVVTDQRLSRDMLDRHLAGATGDSLLFGEYRVVATAGTSGLRGIFVYDRAAWRTVLANTLRWQHFAGIAPRWPNRVRICSIGADNPMHVTSRIPMSGDIGLFQIRHLLATDPIEHLVSSLAEFQPDVILPYPSVAALIAREQLAGRLSISPRVVATHSELLTPEMARLIEQAWGIEAFNHYGLTEEPHVGADCTRHAGLHLFEDTAMIEVVDDEYRPVPDGTLGTRYLLTNLYNRIQPLIRYEVTDMLARAPALCACGRPFGLIAAMGGRAEDLLHLPRADGQRGEVSVTPMLVSLAVEAFLGVREYAVEHDASGIRLRLVVPDAEDRRKIGQALPARLGSDIASHGAVPPPITLEFLDGLARSTQRMGKLSVVARRRGASPQPGCPA